MDKAADSAVTTTTTNTRDQCLRKLNKRSHKISKPPSTSTQPSIESHASGVDSNQQNHLQQPPVYYVSKSDFREVVQKLTGLPAHERLAPPPPIHPSMPPSSRLNRIRPPSLSHLANRTPPLVNATRPQGLNHNLANQSKIPTPVPPAAMISNSGDGNFVNPISRPVAPPSSLPTLPEVHTAAESSVLAYKRNLQNRSTAIESKPYQFTGFPQLPSLAPFPHSPQQQFQLSMSRLPHPPMQPNTRLNQIRPLSMSHLTNQTPPLLNATRPQGLNPNLANQFQIPAPVPPAATNFNSGDGNFVNSINRPAAPLSPLPPLPEVHAASESPVSAYMRHLQSRSNIIESEPYQFTEFSQLPPLTPFSHSPPQQFQLPTSTLPFGWMNSPK